MISIIPPVGRGGVPLLQTATVLLLALLFEAAWEGTGWATLYGGSISVFNLLWLQWRLRRTERRIPLSSIERDPEQSARESVVSLYMASVERFILVAALFMFGMVRLELDPLSLVVGFIVGQLVFVCGSSYERKIN